MNSLKKTQAINLLSQYDQLLQETVDEIKREQEAILTGTMEEIALEYKFREGVKAGLRLFISRLNRYAKDE